uniref:Neugrin n=1 Tax=Bactrocera dorsalis TaxID=27457 RepID=A0A034VSG6_BACDO
MLPKNQIRQLHLAIACMARGVGRRSNPGIGHQLSSMESVDEHLEQDPEGFGDLESDFMTTNHMHREYEREMIQQRERIRHIMVKQKYFRETKLPNLLTYAEKEQMRTLHSRDPEEWTADRLAESFPATPEVVKKIITAKWQARSEHRIRKHDEVVIQNWEKFRSDPQLLKLPPDFQAHLQKFATRRTEDLLAVSRGLPPKPALSRPTKQEFLSIITSCDKYAEKEDAPEITSGNSRTMEKVPKATSAEEETYLLQKVYDKRRMRLQELKKFKLSPTELSVCSSELANNENQTVNQETIEQQSTSKLHNPSGTGIISKSPNNNPFADNNAIEKYECNEIVISTEDQKRFEITHVKDHIHIPRKVWRKGGTYRVEDAYYDDDGELLYRVPGMSGKNG